MRRLFIVCWLTLFSFSLTGNFPGFAGNGDVSEELAQLKSRITELEQKVAVHRQMTRMRGIWKFITVLK